MAKREWKKNLEAILTSIEEATESKAMTKVEAMGFLNKIEDQIATWFDVLQAEAEGEPEDGQDDDSDEELLEASGFELD